MVCEKQISLLLKGMEDFVREYTSYAIAAHECYRHDDKVACDLANGYLSRVREIEEGLNEAVKELGKCLEGK